MPVAQANNVAPRPLKHVAVAAEPAPHVQNAAVERASAGRDDDAFEGSSKSSNGAGVNPFDPFGVASFWMSNMNPFVVGQQLLLASQVFTRGPFGGPFFTGPFE